MVMMKKQLAALLIALIVLMASLGAAAAEAHWEDEGILFEGEYIEIEKEAFRNVALPVRLLYWNASHTYYTEVYLFPQIVRIQYLWRLIQSEDGQIAGAYLVTDQDDKPAVKGVPSAYPRVTVIAGPEYEASAEKTKDPPLVSITGTASAWSFLVGGGAYQITYNAEIHYNYKGEVIKTVPSTVTYGFYLSESGEE